MHPFGREKKELRFLSSPCSICKNLETLRYFNVLCTKKPITQLVKSRLRSNTLVLVDNAAENIDNGNDWNYRKA